MFCFKVNSQHEFYEQGVVKNWQTICNTWCYPPYFIVETQRHCNIFME